VCAHNGTTSVEMKFQQLLQRAFSNITPKFTLK
jgi:hypothetical protein